MNKRDFLAAGCAGALAVVGPVQACRSPDAAATVLDGDTLASWQALLGSDFDLLSTLGGRLMLDEVRPGQTTDHHRQFTLVFEASNELPALGAGTVVLRSSTGRGVALYLEPLAARPRGGPARYAAPFSILG
jgi:hypothetical protein